MGNVCSQASEDFLLLKGNRWLIPGDVAITDSRYMESSNTLWMRLPEEFSNDRLCIALGNRFEIRPHETRQLTYWDTFEWGVWFGGCLLFSEGKHFHLCGREVGWIGSELCGEEISGGSPRFTRDFNAMRGSLGGLLGLRGLTPVLVVKFRQRTADVRNVTGKIICRIELIEASVGKRTRDVSLRCCRIVPLRGYEAESLPVTEVLAGLGAETLGDGPLEFLLQRQGIAPREYTLRPVFGLNSEDPARKALGRIVHGMLMIARSNEEGILSDLDTEFLHDYRICIRKIRSALGLIKGVYPEEETLRMRSILRDLACATNCLRDLEVYLLAREEYLGLLPSAFQPALDLMFQDFASERSSAFRKVSAHMRSPARVRFFEELEAFFLEDGPHPPSTSSELPVGPLVFRRIYKRYRKIRQSACGLGPDAPDEGLHGLRIQCKKLRDLMEFFAELIPRDKAAAMEKPLRRLQGRLGDFNDGSVQQKFLLDYWDKKQRASGGQTGMALSLGGLISILHYRRQQHREKIQEALASFLSPATAELFKQTFRLPAIEPTELPIP